MVKDPGILLSWNNLSTSCDRGLSFRFWLINTLQKVEHSNALLWQQLGQLTFAILGKSKKKAEGAVRTRSV